MEEAVRGRFLLDYPRKGGVTLRKTLESVEQQSGVHDPQLDIPDIPEGFESWYIRFMELRRGEALKYADIDAYQRITGVQLNAAEIMGLFAMDHGASVAIAEIMEAK